MMLVEMNKVANRWQRKEILTGAKLKRGGGDNTVLLMFNNLLHFFQCSFVRVPHAWTTGW